jgi:hypothetical protein
MLERYGDDHPAASSTVQPISPIFFLIPQFCSWLLGCCTYHASETRPIVGDIIYALEFIQENAVATRLNPKPETHCVLQM